METIGNYMEKEWLQGKENMDLLDLPNIDRGGTSCQAVSI